MWLSATVPIVALSVHTDIFLAILNILICRLQNSMLEHTKTIVLPTDPAHFLNVCVCNNEAQPVAFNLIAPKPPGLPADLCSRHPSTKL